jgi:hypothetical protein
MSTDGWPGTAASNASINSAFSARVPCIFQFPATKGRRIAIPRVNSWVDLPREPADGLPEKGAAA